MRSAVPLGKYRMHNSTEPIISLTEILLIAIAKHTFWKKDVFRFRGEMQRHIFGLGIWDCFMWNENHKFKGLLQVSNNQFEWVLDNLGWSYNYKKCVLQRWIVVGNLSVIEFCLRTMWKNCFWFLESSKWGKWGSKSRIISFCGLSICNLGLYGLDSVGFKNSVDTRLEIYLLWSSNLMK